MTTDEYLAIDGNTLIDDPDETLLRQVHPLQMDGDEPTTAAFLPSQNHNFLLSTKRERVGPREACEAHQQIPLETAGTWGVRVSDAADASTPAIDDAAHTGQVDHASLSFLDLPTPGRRRQSARKLRDAARCLYRVP